MLVRQSSLLLDGTVLRKMVLNQQNMYLVDCHGESQNGRYDTIKFVITSVLNQIYLFTITAGIKWCWRNVHQSMMMQVLRRRKSFCKHTDKPFCKDCHQFNFLTFYITNFLCSSIISGIKSLLMNPPNLPPR